MPRHNAPQQPSWLRPRLVVAFVVAAAGLVTAVWLPTRNDSADAAERDRGNDRRRDQSLSRFDDDFSGRLGSTVDHDKWSLRTDGGGRGLRFSENVRNARLDGDGNLAIVLRDGERDDTFTSARLVTRNTLRGAAGHLEARVRTPQGKGLQPAFELVPAANQRAATLNLLAEPVADDEFHTYSMDWSANEVSLSVDGKRVNRRAMEGVDTAQPFRLALGLSVTDDRNQTDLPARMVVDSVHFAAADAPAEPTTPPTTESPEPPTSEPPTSEPPTSEPPTSEPPTSEPPTSEPPSTAPTTTPPAPTKPPPTSAPAATAWAPFTDYVAGQLVTYKGVTYEVLQTHTSLPGWEPTVVPALFSKV